MAVEAGEDRYASAIQVKLPQLPADQELATFKLVLTEIPNFTFHSDSPAFRQVVFATIKAVGVRDPAVFASEMQEVPGEATISEEHLGVEACAIIVDWEDGLNQDGAGAPDNDLPVREDTDGDGERETIDPQIDCALGATGERDEAAGTWTFDLTFAANSWLEGDLENRGVFLRPLAAANLAYGDPDPTTWDQATFEGSEAEDEAARPQVIVATEEKSELLSFGGGTFTAPPADSGEVQGSQARTFTETFGDIGGVQEPADVERPVVEPSPPPLQAAPAGLAGNPVTEWWVWLLLPLFLGGGWLVTQALAAAPAPALERAGAMTRLIEARRAAQS